MTALVLADELRRLVAEGSVSTEEAVLVAHGGSSGYSAPKRPDVVVLPTTVEEVSRVCAYASRTGTPLVPFGAGTGLGSGSTIPVRGGITLDLSRLDQVLDVDGDNLLAVVQAGVRRLSLAGRLREEGLFFPVDPGGDASLAGMTATNASGSATMRYGSMRQNVRALQVVLADGAIVRTGTRARKSSAGYDMTGLFVGSEGTLGVITEVTVKVARIPGSVVAARAVFESVDAAIAAVLRLSTLSQVSRLEFIDGETIELVNAYQGTDYTTAPTLFIELGGPARVVFEELAQARTLAADAGCSAFVSEEAEAAQQQLWRARHQVGFAMKARYPDRALAGTDVCVPVSELPAAVRFARQELDRRGLEGAILAHAGDGNYHVSFAVDIDDAGEVERVKRFYGALVTHALERGGTCTGEHGIGLAKLDFLEQEHGDLVPAMRAVKAALDPAGILNPGKVFRDAPNSLPSRK